jgi:eukaryotic-like serine/threonine-protein kinase
VTSAAPPANCPKCQAPLQTGVNFCGNCGSLISGVWGSRTEMFGKTVGVQITDSADTLAELLTHATIGEYDIYGELGRGGMAAVYLALDLSLNRKVAIKTMLPELVVKTDMVERFKREAQTAAGLSHPHIIQIHAVKETPALVYFVMKFIEGRSLESIALEQGPLGVGMAQVVLGQIASALAYAHRKGVVHRDVKPANVMIDEDGWAIVTDFGIAKVQVAQNLTATGTAIGTPTYMSPEQFHNKAITGASDQYSLGVVAYEVLSGKKPFDGATYAEIITQHLFEPVPDLKLLRPDLPESLVSTINRMLAKNPTERFADLDAAAVALGSPDKAESERIRAELISMAKSGPRRTVRMSVPVSPIPMTKKPSTPTATTAAAGAAATIVAAQPAPARTVPDKRPAKPRLPETVPVPAKRKAPLWGAIAAVVVAAAAFGTWKALSSNSAPPATSAVEQPQAVAATPAGAPATPETKTEGPASTADATTAARPADNAPAPARIIVSDVPANAVITLDGRRQSGRQFTARPGTYQLRVQASGFETMSRRITVAAGEQLPITFERRALSAAPAPVAAAPQAPPAQGGLATMRIVLQPPATLFIDGANKGEVSRLQEELVPGTHTVRVEKSGFVTKDTLVTILAGQSATIRLNLVARP